ncbi:MAG: hypothetical protein KY456_05000 [Chloroflexi bacterium]|nr:hypothetical protein [Chloroflexota bacterium]
MSESTDRSPTVCIVLNRDLLFGSRIRSALDSLGLRSQFVGNAGEFVDALLEHRESAAIGIIDMNGPVSWDVIGETLGRGDVALAPTLAFGPHVDVESRRAAKAAGITRIVSNGQFHGDMVGLIERYRQR